MVTSHVPIGCFPHNHLAPSQKSTSPKPEVRNTVFFLYLSMNGCKLTSDSGLTSRLRDSMSSYHILKTCYIERDQPPSINNYLYKCYLATTGPISHPFHVPIRTLLLLFKSFNNNNKHPSMNEVYILPQSTPV